MQIRTPITLLALAVASAAALGAQSRAEIAARADSAWTTGDHRAAERLYQVLVLRDSFADPVALLRLGVLNAWRGRINESRRLLGRLVAHYPKDVGARVALGRTLSWASRFAASLAQYDSALTLDPSSVEATLGRASVLAWSGRTRAAVAALEAWQRSHPADVDAALLRTRFLLWRGRPGLAHRTLDSLGGRASLSALTGQARDEWRWVNAEVAPMAALRFVSSDDSEKNRSEAIDLSGRIALLGPVRVDAAARQKRLSRDGSATPARSLRAVQGGVSIQPAGVALGARVELGVADFGETSEGGSLFTGAFRLTAPLGADGMIGASITRGAFDDIVSAAYLALTVTDASVDLSAPILPGLALAVEAGSGSVQGEGSANGRTHAAAEVRWILWRRSSLRFSRRDVAWERAAPGTYFAPEHFALTELAAGWELARDLGLVAGFDAGVGTQVVAFPSVPPVRGIAPRLALKLGWKAAPGRELVLTVLRAASATAGTEVAEDYYARVVTVAGRWTF